MSAGDSDDELPVLDESVKQRAWQVARNGALLVTFIDSHFVDMAGSWALRARHIGIDNVMVGVLDLAAEVVRTACAR